MSARLALAWIAAILFFLFFQLVIERVADLMNFKPYYLGGFGGAAFVMARLWIPFWMSQSVYRAIRGEGIKNSAIFLWIFGGASLLILVITAFALSSFQDTRIKTEPSLSQESPIRLEAEESKKLRMAKEDQEFQKRLKGGGR